MDFTRRNVLNTPAMATGASVFGRNADAAVGVSGAAPAHTRGRSRMWASRTYGSVRVAPCKRMEFSRL